MHACAKKGKGDENFLTSPACAVDRKEKGVKSGRERSAERTVEE